MITRVLKSWETLRLSALLLAVVALGTSGVSLAQPEPAPVTIRGFAFDPAELERATAAELERLGIEEGLQARVPDGNGVLHWRLMQFSRPIDRETRRDLVMRGLELQRYMAGMYLERVTLETVDALRSSGVLSASVLYHPVFKLSPSIRGARLLEPRTFQTDQRRRVPGLLLRATTFPTATNLDASARQIQALGGLDVFVQDNRRVGGPGRLVFRLDGAGDERARALMNVARIDEIESIEEVGEIVADNANAASVNQSGDSAKPTIWNRKLMGQGQAIGIFDVGVADTSHCFFKDPNPALGNMPGLAHRKLLEVRNQSQYSEGDSDHQHATATAAIAAGDDYNPSPAHDTERGGAWAARLVLASIYDFYEVTSLNLSGDTVVLNAPPSTLPIELAAVGQQAKVTSHSWHDRYHEGYSDTAEDFDRFARSDEDQIVIASAGKPTQNWGPPAISKNTIAVSAASLNTTQILDGYWSNPSPGRQKPDLAAVGCGIKTAKYSAVANSCDITATLDCKTSFAAPQAAAIAALARQYYVDGQYNGQSLPPTGSLVKATLINSAQNVTLQPDFPSMREGWGIVQLDKTLAFPDSDRDLFVDDVRNTGPQALETGGQREYAFEVRATSQPLKVTLVWTDPAGDAGVADLVNNLDLEVVSPGGVTYLGNRFNPSIGESIPGGPADTKNNVEQVLVNPPPVGKWMLRVKAQNIAQIEAGLQGQGYALVATAGRPTQNAPTHSPTPPTNFVIQ